LLWTLQRMFFGTLRLKEDSWLKALTDLNVREIFTFTPLAVLALILGIMPSLVFDVINASVNQFITLFR